MGAIICNLHLTFFSADDLEDITRSQSSQVKCFSNGVITLTVYGKDKSFCAMDLRYFPFDEQLCRLEFWHVFRSGRNYADLDSEYSEEYEQSGDSENSDYEFLNAPIGVVFYADSEDVSTKFSFHNGEWEVLYGALKTFVEVLHFAGEDESYPVFFVELKLKRKPSFYVIILVLPSLLVSSISIVGFLLPSEAGEKVSLQLTSLLSYMLLLLVVVDIIPPIGGGFPIIGINKYHRSDRDNVWRNGDILEQ